MLQREAGQMLIVVKQPGTVHKLDGHQEEVPYFLLWRMTWQDMTVAVMLCTTDQVVLHI